MIAPGGIRFYEYPARLSFLPSGADGRGGHCGRGMGQAWRQRMFNIMAMVDVRDEKNR